MAEDSEVRNESFWNELARLHFDSTYYDVVSFRQTRCSLRDLELSELGPIRGRSILHLQCHFGMDTLSLAHLGANACGVDFSSEGIRLAMALGSELSIPARFICANVHDLDACLSEEFDIIFCSYGILAWLGGLRRWAQTIARHLKKGGFFYIVDEHPFARTFVNPGTDNQSLYTGQFFDYWEALEPTIASYKHSYADTERPLANSTQYIWRHSLSELLNAFASAGLMLEFLHEFDKTFYRMFVEMRQEESGWWVLNKHRNGLPLMFSLKAIKPA